jgi:hypothetical protein
MGEASLDQQAIFFGLHISEQPARACHCVIGMSSTDE